MDGSQSERVRGSGGGETRKRGRDTRAGEQDTMHTEARAAGRCVRLRRLLRVRERGRYAQP